MKIIKFVAIFSLFNLIYSNPNKFVITQHIPSGFFSIFLNALNNIYWAHRNDKIPVVYWGRDCLYYKKSGYNGSKNVWEYYFKQVSNLKYNKYFDEMHTNYFAPDRFGIPYYKGCYNYTFHQKTKFIINDIIKLYIKVKKPITEKINNFYRENMKGKINIGIHLRGTDKKFEAKPIDPSLIINKANEIASKFGKRCQFFVATDEQSLLDFAINNLNRKVIYYNSHRSMNDKCIHNRRGKLAALLGEEILIEAKLLSKCDYFLHTRTNVATGVMLFNPYIKNIFFEN